jgi:hypothetical protein
MRKQEDMRCQGKLKIKGEWFVDRFGRTVLLRGVNLGGNCKFPARPYGATHIKTDFRDHDTVSFVGHPFSISEASEHFSRLRNWGFNALRFLVTWEAVEHAGPGLYDERYLDYLEELLDLAADQGFYFIIDPHQDVWSRMSGGDGAPGWTFEKAGLDYTKFDACGAALLMQRRYSPDDPQAYPPMHWTGNVVRLACATMFTLFFGGRDFAPGCTVEERNIQDFLQDHFLESMKRVAGRVKDNPGLLGFDILNEPHPGWIGLRLDGSNNESRSHTLGYAFTPFQAMATGAGYPCRVGFQQIKGFKIKETGSVQINQDRICCWLAGDRDIWRKENVWGWDANGEPVILNNDHFLRRNGKQVDFFRDYLSPFIAAFTREIRSVVPETAIFLQGPPLPALNGRAPGFRFPKNMGKLVFAPHWYDALTLSIKKPMTRISFDMTSRTPVVGRAAVTRMFVRQLSGIMQPAAAIQNGIPKVLGEFGLPYDLNQKEAYLRWQKGHRKVWRKHEECLSMYYEAIDANLLNSFQWNYTPDNSNEHGDGWNLEDLSVYSSSQRSEPGDPNDGGRAVSGFCRPHFLHCAGVPLRMHFDPRSATFLFRFRHDPAIEAPTLLYVPNIHYPNGYRVQAPEGEIERMEDEQLLLVRFHSPGEKRITVKRAIRVRRAGS